MPEIRTRIWLNVLSSFTKIKEDTESFNSEKVSGLESCGPETATPFAVAWLPSHRHGAMPVPARGGDGPARRHGRVAHTPALLLQHVLSGTSRARQMHKAATPFRCHRYGGHEGCA